MTMMTNMTKCCLKWLGYSLVYLCWPFSVRLFEKNAEKPLKLVKMTWVTKKTMMTNVKRWHEWQKWQWWKIWQQFFLNDSNIAWFVFIDLFQPNYLKKLLKNVKNSQNDLSEKNDSDDKYDNSFFKWLRFSLVWLCWPFPIKLVLKIA